MERELTVKVNYVLGNQSAFTEAASHAENVNKKIGQVGDSFLSRFQSAMTGGGVNGQGVLGMLAGGVGSLGIAGMGVGAVGVGIGHLASDLAMGGGAGMRGPGLSGINDSFWGMVSGRSTSEALVDQTMRRSSEEIARQQIRHGGFVDELRARNADLHQFSTNADPFQRVQENREVLRNRWQQAAIDNLRSMRGFDASRAAIEAQHDKLGDNTVEGRRARNASLAAHDNNVLEAKKRWAAEEVARAAELNALDKGVFEEKKGMIRGMRLSLGGMTQPESQSLLIAARQMDAAVKGGKERLMPEQLAMLSAHPVFAEQSNKYRELVSKESGMLPELLVLAGGDIGRAAKRHGHMNVTKEEFQAAGGDLAKAVDKKRAAHRAAHGGSDEIEDYLESGEIYAASTKLKQMLGTALGEVISSLTDNSSWLTTTLQQMGMMREKQGPRQ